MGYTVLIINTRIDKNQKTNQYLQNTLKDLSKNADIKTVHYHDINDAMIEQTEPNKIILSGQNTPFKYYSKDKLNLFFETIKKTRIPILGICGGHQLLSLCYGGTVAPMRVLNEMADDYDGCWREKGFVRVIKQTVNDPVLKELDKTMIVYEDHCDEVKQVPDVFRVLCKGDQCKVQGIKHWRKPIYGVQFHPERYGQDYLDGQRILLSFLAL